jgi:heme-degrading monooxygenase HmoA
MAGETWLRVVIYRTRDIGNAAALDYMKESTTQTLAMLEGQPGFRLGYWGLDPDEGTMAAVTYWSSEDAITRATAQLIRLHEQRAAHGISVESIQNVQLFTVPTLPPGATGEPEEPKTRRRRGRR